MQVTYFNGIFNCICTYHEKDYPKAAGFVWDKITPKTWATKDASIAYKLIKVANKEALEAITLFMKKATENMEASRAKNADVNIPCPNTLEYLPFQKAGITFACEQMLNAQHHSVLIADEMGLGKTIQAIGVINCMEKEMSKPMVLIVCPASLKLNWQQELRKWLVKENKIAIVNSDSPWPNANVYIVNYDILVQPCPICRGHTKEEKARCSTCEGTGSYKKFHQLYDMQWDLIVADESHRLKSGRKSKQATAFFQMQTKWKLPMTGTPLLSRPIEIWSTLSWLDKNTWGNRFMFGKRYCNLQQTRFGMDFNGASNLAELQNRLRGGGYMLRRMKADVLTELPPKFRQVIELPAEGLEQVIDAEWNAYHKYESFLESLKVAEELFKNKTSPLWVVISSYYSMFYIANAYIYKKGYKASHDIVHQVINETLIVLARHDLEKHFVEEYEEEKLKALSASQNLLEVYESEKLKRAEFQYETTGEVKESKAKTSFERAKNFVSVIRQIIKNL